MRWSGIPLILLAAIAVVVLILTILEQRGEISTTDETPQQEAGRPTQETLANSPKFTPPPVHIPTVPTERHQEILSDGWLFTKGEAHLAKEPITVDPPWERVSVPHSWNVADGSDGGTYYRGIGWYRRWVDIPISEQGRSVILHFAGANIVTTVYINGEWAGEHAGGFGAFAFDITPQIRFGTPNLIAVKVNNAERLNVPPIYADFTFSGGLYRPVTVITASPLHLNLTTDGWNGVHYHQRKVTAEVAEIDCEIAVRNDTSSAASAQVVVGIRDAAGTVVATAQAPISVEARRSATITIPVKIERPRRWHGKQDPHLYDTVVQVRSGPVVIDQVNGTVGLRSFRMDPAQGFFLNDQPYDLHGVGLHQDRLGKGWIVSSEDRREDLALLQELGATFVRLAHYQHPQEAYGLMDRAGIVVWAELPVLMQAGRDKKFGDSARSQLRELIRQNAHHPSIVCWGLFNEIGSQPEDVAIISDLHTLAKQLDPLRPTTAATYAADAAEVNFVTDIISFNKYFGWFLPNINAFGPWADNIHKKYPERAVGITEYGAGGSIRRHEEEPQAPIPGLGKMLPGSHSENYHTLFHETVWPQLASRPFLWCKSAWVLCDFTSDQQNTGDAPGYTDMGLVTGDRKVRKDAFFYYKTQWSDQPVLHIANRRFTKRRATIDITVYANVDGVALRLNGILLPAVKADGGVFRWRNVTLQAGENRVEARGQRGDQIVRDEVRWLTE